jgi:glycosyltransferase involved in cell wall biosynthesis
MLRIVNIIQCSNLGGMEQASLRLMQALQRRGHILSLISLHPLGALGPQLQASIIPALGLGYGQEPPWRWLWRLRQELRRQRPDVLLLTGHSLPALLSIAGVCRRRRLLAIHFHHTGVKPRWFWRVYYALAHRMVNAVTFPSDFVRQEAVRIYPPLARKAHTVRNPIAASAPITPAERLAARLRFGLPASGPILGNAGWLIERKRFDVFLHTAAAIFKQQPDARFLIAGDGPERDRLHALAHQLGLAHAVVWTGWVEDMRGVYAALDVLIFSSDWDALPTTPIEAIVHRIPVVASLLHGGLAEVLRPGVDATLLARHDAPALAQAALRLLADSTAAAAMTAQAREHLLALSDPDHLAAWHERTFTMPTAAL